MKFYLSTFILATLFNFATTEAQAQVFTIDQYGIVKCPTATPGQKGTLFGEEYEAVDRALLEQRINAGADLTYVCTSLVTDMSNLFVDRTVNFPIGNWDVSNVTNMTWMFRDAFFNQDISTWDVSKVTNMHQMFIFSDFNQPIGDWDVSNVTDMSLMFYGTPFNQPIGSWNVSSVTRMNEMFRENNSFNQDLSDWNVSSVTHMNRMFYAAQVFNSDISTWDVSKVVDMHSMFEGSAFNQSISDWNVGNVINMNRVFLASPFNQPIGNWNVSSVTDMSEIFSNSSFNQDISSWDVSKVTNMRGMFEGSSFNQPIGNWRVGNVTNMVRMFLNTPFNHPLTQWCVSTITSEPSEFSSNGALTDENKPIWGSCPGRPATVTLASPTNNQTNILSTPTLSWNEADGALEYELEVLIGSRVVLNEIVTGTSYTFESPLNGNTYYRWRVRGLNDSQNPEGLWSTTWRFLTELDPVVQVQLESPLNNATDVNPSAKLSWVADLNASSYMVEVSIDGFESSFLIEETTETTLITPQLPLNTLISWRVRASNSLGDGPWSETGTFTTSDFATIVIEVFNPVTGRTWMDRNLGASRAATSMTDTEAYGDLYQWGRGSDGHQKRNSSTTTTLSGTDQPEHGSFILSSGNPGDWRNPQNNNLWQEADGVNNPCPVGYRLPTNQEWAEEIASWQALDAEAAFTSALKLTVAGARGSSSGGFGDVGSAGLYWSGSAYENYAYFVNFGNSFAGIGYSTPRASGFTLRCIKNIEVIPTDQVILGLPEDQNRVSPHGLNFTWFRDVNATSYTIEVSTDNFETFSIQESVTDTSFTTSALAFATAYQWRVRATNTAGNGEWSDVRSFTTGQPIPALIYPGNGATGLQKSFTFEWSSIEDATSYSFELVNSATSEPVYSAESIASTQLSTSETLIEVNGESVTLASLLEYDASYTWRVRLFDAQNPGEWSDYATFTMIDTRTATLSFRLPVYVVGDDQQFDLTIGASTQATTGYDDGLDIPAPPMAPNPVIDARFVREEFEYITEFLPLNETVAEWRLRIIRSSGQNEVQISWNPVNLPETGDFTLYSLTDNSVRVNMRDVNEVLVDVGQSSDFVIQHRVSTTGNQSVSIDYRAGWNLVGLPVQLDHGSYLDLFPGANQNSMFQFNGGYSPSQQLTPGTGYWIRFGAPSTSNLEGGFIEEVTWNLKSGWNLVSGPSSVVSVSSIVDESNVIIDGTIFSYESSYSPSSLINPGRGYWLRASNDGVATLGTSVASKQQSIADVVAYRGSRKIQFTNGGYETLLFWDSDNSTIPNPESYSLPPIPPVGSFDVRFDSDMRRTSSETAVLAVQMNDKPTQINIELDGDANDDEFGTEYILTFLNASIEIESMVVSVSESVTVPQSTTHLKVEPLAQIDELPAEFTLEQNYPNPFNPTTTIRFGLPAATDVRLEVYSILGQKVMTLLNESRSAGWHTVTLNASGLSSGVYVYRIHAGDQISTKKLLLLK